MNQNGLKSGIPVLIYVDGKNKIIILNVQPEMIMIALLQNHRLEKEIALLESVILINNVLRKEIVVMMLILVLQI